MKQTILVVDDEPAQRQFVGGSLSKDYEILSAANGREASQVLSHQSVSLVITDERMPEMGGIELVRWLREKSPETPVIVLTAYGSVSTAVEAIKLGAEEYLTKPLKSPEELRIVVEKVLSRRALLDRSLLHQQETDAAFPSDVVAESESMKQIFRLAGQVAPQPSTVLLTGESGTGKEVVARFIHRRSPRRDRAFVAVNCAAIPETLLESELFGHEKGAFTGATQTRRGRFELADGGTLFLDEIAEMGSNLQAKFLRVLQEQRFERIGSDRSIAVDVRVIAATNKDLTQAIAGKSFREDLYYRLSVFPIHIPPLRERREDILPLAELFARGIAVRMGKPVPSLAQEASEFLQKHDWPGNVRELANAIERALIVSQSAVIEKDDLPMKGEPSMDSRPGLLAQVEKKTIMESLARNGGDRRATSEELGISLRTLQYRLKEFAIAGKD
ncbi:MAG: two component, sigma54 specific, transcriptional regulator, Fis family [Acidobacteria bacterium]|nr:two component, sigma54 specific, transcriptional regulator, Fis family [Acidobacteriota bacterium]